MQRASIMTHWDACSFSVASWSGRKFTGKERDAESGNDYATFRYHVNRLGRFFARVFE